MPPSPVTAQGLPPRLQVPPVPPHIHRSLHVRLTKRGIAIDPATEEETAGLLLPWGSHSVPQARESTRAGEAVGVAGILGIMRLWDVSYLLLIMPGPSVQLGDRTAHLVQHVASIPLDAEAGPREFRKLQNQPKFKWPFKRSRNPSPELDDETGPEAGPSTGAWNSAVSQETPSRPTRQELEEKIVAQTVREFSSGGFYYSYDTDLSHTLAYKRRRISRGLKSSTALASLLDAPAILSEAPDIHLPLWRRTDRRFFWNEHLAKDFIDQGFHSFVLPLLQGWIQSATIGISAPVTPEKNEDVPVEIMISSRRSRDRAGLRYQRRGIDDEGHVANFVETEMIVKATVEEKTSVFSFVQIRGSIPLKWSQQPWSMKPPPVLDQPVDQTFSIANLHFDDLTTRYGPISCINLSEQTGKEAAVTNGFQELISSLDRKDVQLKMFDFHAKCHGMKWENISELVGELDLDSMGYTWILDGEEVRQQDGVYRTNCIDCLDRTNVVQSAIARKVLTAMLAQLGLIPSSPQFESTFNDIWANNGDTISLCYAHTSALKGDFVRTGKRDVKGMINDGVSSLSRMFYGAVSDFFAQAVISFMLGQRNLSVFSEFLETLSSTDATNLIKLSRIRAAAIETSSARVLEGERRIAGWTLLSPEDRNARITLKLEEKVLLLTEEAIYVVSFNYSLEKVVGFTRIPLISVTGLQQGAYILSPLQESGRDPRENAGFLITFTLHESRYSSYSIKNQVAEDPGAHPASAIPGADAGTGSNPSKSSDFFAFKVLPREFIARGASTFDDDDLDSDANPSETCQDVVVRLVKRVKEACAKQGNKVDVEERDIVSLAEAQTSTGLIARVDYALKRFLWL